MNVPYHRLQGMHDCTGCCPRFIQAPSPHHTDLSSVTQMDLTPSGLRALAHAGPSAYNNLIICVTSQPLPLLGLVNSFFPQI